MVEMPKIIHLAPPVFQNLWLIFYEIKLGPLTSQITGPQGNQALLITEPQENQAMLIAVASLRPTMLHCYTNKGPLLDF